MHDGIFYRLLTNGMFILLLLSLPQCANHRQLIKKRVTLKKHNSEVTRTSQNPPITVWIHGTKLLRRPLFYRCFNGKPSLKKPDDLFKKSHLRLIANTLCSTAADQFDYDHFYIFGWSGRLSASERRECAGILLQELESLHNIYRQKYGCDPKIRMIAHSHGGNIALNVAQLYDYYKSQPLSIDELILLACPVQTQNRDLISSPLFKRVYALYSSLDIVQVIAPEVHCLLKQDGNKICRKIKFPPLSARRFPPQPHVSQLKIKLNGRGLWHADFVGVRFLQLLAPIIQEIDVWHQESPDLALCQQQQLLSVYHPS